MIREEGRKRDMTVYQIETRDKDYRSIIITASYERTREALDTAEERNVDVIVTPYTLEDCDGEWVTATIQSNNTSRNKYIFYENETHTIAEWSRIKNVPYSVLFHRLKLGWDLDKVFNTKVGYRCQK